MGRKSSTHSVSSERAEKRKNRHEEAKHGDGELSPMEIDVKEGKKEEKKEDSMSDFFSEMMGSLPALKKRVYFIMDSGPMQVFLITLLLLSLFITDAWTLGNPAVHEHCSRWHSDLRVNHILP